MIRGAACLTAVTAPQKPDLGALAGLASGKSASGRGVTASPAV